MMQKLGTKQVVSTHLKHSYCLLCGILHHMTTENPEYPNILILGKVPQFC